MKKCSSFRAPRPFSCGKSLTILDDLGSLRSCAIESHSVGTGFKNWESMLELYGVQNFSTDIDLKLVRDVVFLSLDLDVSHTLSGSPFLCAVFLNGRFEDSCGRVQRVNVGEGWTREAVVFSFTELGQLQNNYQKYLKELNKAGGGPSLYEVIIWSFVQLCSRKNMTLLSFSELVLKESE